MEIRPRSLQCFDLVVQRARTVRTRSFMGLTRERITSIAQLSTDGTGQGAEAPVRITDPLMLGTECDERVGVEVMQPTEGSALTAVGPCEGGAVPSQQNPIRRGRACQRRGAGRQEAD